MENVKTLGEFETIRIKFEGREEHIEISGNGEMRYDLGTVGGAQNVFEYAEQTGAGKDLAQAQNTSQTLYNPISYHDAFYRQQSYLSSLIEVASRTDHKLHDEIDDAVKKLKELSIAG